MNKILILLAAVFVPTGNGFCNNYPDSTDYWINVDYITCLESGNSVCDCLQKNEFTIIHINLTDKKIYVQSSVFHFGLETHASFDIIPSTDTGNYRIAKTHPLAGDLDLKIYDDVATISGKDVKAKFKRKRLKTLSTATSEKSVYVFELDMHEQLNTLNAIGLLPYQYLYEADSTTVFYTVPELQKLIQNQALSISCSDDHYYNELRVITEKGVAYYHLDYSGDFVTLYHLPDGRDRMEKIEITGLKKQILFKIIDGK